MWRPAHDFGTLDPEACGARAAGRAAAVRAVLRGGGHGRFFVKSALSAVGARATLEVAISVWCCGAQWRVRNDLDGSDSAVVKQERGVRTRNHLISVAAAEFDRNGYDGTSLSRLSRSAGISIGALTFHFAAKGELASAVEDSGRAATRRVVEGVTARGGPALDTVSALVLALGRLIETDAAVRAAARLTQERIGAGPDWCGCWLPDVKELLEQAAEQGQLDPEVDPCPVTLLTAHLVGGVVTRVRRGRGELPGAVTGELRELWRLIRRGIAAPTDPEMPK